MLWVIRHNSRESMVRGCGVNWKLKCLTFHLLEHIPAGKLAHEFLQRYATRSYFTALTPERLCLYQIHVKHYQRLGRPWRVLEFGAGGELLAPLLLSAAGASEIRAYDVTRLATVPRINHMISQLRALVPGEWPALTTMDDLWSLYRIRYVAPVDAGENRLATGSVDFVLSTSTLKHISPREIRSILTECRRVCSGRMSFIIDYSDHCAKADRSITPMNFYRYTTQQWRWLNPRWHFQSRLRRADFVTIFRELGLQIVD